MLVNSNIDFFLFQTHETFCLNKIKTFHFDFNHFQLVFGFLKNKIKGKFEIKSPFEPKNQKVENDQMKWSDVARLF